MKCLICGKFAYTVGSREPSAVVGTVHRTRRCNECQTEFKTTEKIVFSSLPPYVREKFLNEGKLK